MYKIGLFSQINKVTVKTLRYYDETGLLKPAFVDKINGYRYYTSEQLPVLHRIIALKQSGFSIDDIRMIIKEKNVNEIFLRKKKDIEATIEAEKRQLVQIEHYLTQIKEDKKMSYQVAMKELPEVLVYSKRFIVKNYDSYFSCIPEIGEEVKKANPDLQCLTPEYCFIIYHDGEYKEEDIDVEFCEAVTKKGVNTKDVTFKTIPKVEKAACIFHKGAYSEIRNAYKILFEWIKANNYEIFDKPRESYIDGIWNKDNPEDWLTEIQIPVK